MILTHTGAKFSLIYIHALPTTYLLVHVVFGMPALKEAQLDWQM